jgi:hypothetical protein
MLTVPEDSTDLAYKNKLKESSPDIIRVDFNDKLEIFSYKKCDNDSPELIKNCRSTIFAGDKVISQGFKFTPEFTTDTDIGMYIQNLSKCSFYRAYEGFLIRIFNHDDVWYITTNKRLNAYKSYWSSSESFGTLFTNALVAGIGFDPELIDRLSDPGDITQNFLKCLLPNTQYMFLISNNSENRIVCDAPPVPIMYHISSICNTKTLPNSSTDFSYIYERQQDLPENYIGIPRPEQLFFNSMNELYNCVFNTDIRKYQGVLVKSTEKKQYKILNPLYKKMSDIRGNEASLNFRYLQLRKDFRQDITLFKKMYPSMIEKIKTVEIKIADLCCYLHTLYTNKYIKKIVDPKRLSPEQYNIIKKCHACYLETRQYINKPKVFEILNNLNPSHLNKLLKNFSHVDYV